MLLEFQDKLLYIHEVQKCDEVVQSFLDSSLETFEPNVNGPIEYIKVYNDYLYLLDGKAGKSLEEFIDQDPPPFIRVCILLCL